MSDKDFSDLVNLARFLAREVATELAGYREDCTDWSVRPSKHFGPFGTLGTDLLRQVVELIKERNTRAKADPLAQSQFQMTARQIAKAAAELSPDDFSDTNGLKEIAVLALTATRVEYKLIMPLFTDIRPAPTLPSHEGRKPASFSLPARPKARPIFTLIQGGLRHGTD